MDHDRDRPGADERDEAEDGSFQAKAAAGIGPQDFAGKVAKARAARRSAAVEIKAAPAAFLEFAGRRPPRQPVGRSLFSWRANTRNASGSWPGFIRSPALLRRPPAGRRKNRTRELLWPGSGHATPRVNRSHCTGNLGLIFRPSSELSRAPGTLAGSPLRRAREGGQRWWCEGGKHDRHCTRGNLLPRRRIARRTNRRDLLATIQVPGAGSGDALQEAEACALGALVPDGCAVEGEGAFLFNQESPA